MFERIRKRLPEMPASGSVLIPISLVFMLGAFGSVCLSSTHVYLMEQAVCRKNFENLQPTKISNGGLIDEEICKIPEIQSVVARIHGVYNVLTFIPALLLTGPWGKIAEIIGKKTTMFLNAISFTLAGIYFTAVCYFYQIFDIRWIYLTPLFDLIGGGNVILFSFIYTYISESVGPENLSGVFYKLSAIQGLVAFLAMSLSSVLLRSNVWLQCTIGIITLSFMIPITLLFPSHQPSPLPTSPQQKHYTPSPTSDSDSDSEASTSSTPLLSTPNPSAQPSPIFKTIISALKGNLFHTLTLFKTIIYSSPLSRTTLLTYFILILGTRISVIFSQWTSITFGWIFAEVNALNSYEMILSFLLLLSLPFLSPFFNSPSQKDLFITKFSIGMIGFGVLCMGFAPGKVSYVVAVTVFTMGAGLNDSLRSWVTGLMMMGKGGEGEGRVEKLYLGIGMVETVGGMLGTVVWSAVFSKVLGGSYWLLRGPFMVSAGVMGVVFGCVIFLDRGFGRGRGGGSNV